MYKRILVPIDGSATATAGLDEAIRLARITGAELRLLHVLDAAAYATGFEPAAVYCNEIVPHMKRAGERVLEEATQRVRRNGLKADSVLLETIAERVCDLVVAHAIHWDADLIVIGTHGRHGVGRLLLGSDAEQIMRTAPVPVLLVRTDGEEGARSMRRVAGSESSAAVAM
jgi:nucleotide-binding universal stress UspA family protein